MSKSATIDRFSRLGICRESEDVEKYEYDLNLVCRALEITSDELFKLTDSEIKTEVSLLKYKIKRLALKIVRKEKFKHENTSMAANNQRQTAGAHQIENLCRARKKIDAAINNSQYQTQICQTKLNTKLPPSQKEPVRCSKRNSIGIPKKISPIPNEKLTISDSKFIDASMDFTQILNKIADVCDVIRQYCAKCRDPSQKKNFPKNDFITLLLGSGIILQKFHELFEDQN